MFDMVYCMFDMVYFMCDMVYCMFIFVYASRMADGQMLILRSDVPSHRDYRNRNTAT
jgi:hypothetical protein